MRINLQKSRVPYIDTYRLRICYLPLIVFCLLLSPNNINASDNKINLSEIISNYNKFHNIEHTDSCLELYVRTKQIDTNVSVLKDELDFFRFSTLFYRKIIDLDYNYILYDKYLYSLEQNHLDNTEEYCEALLNYSLICMSLPKWSEAINYCKLAQTITLSNGLSTDLLNRINERLNLLNLLYGISPLNIEYPSSTDSFISKLLCETNDEYVNKLKEDLYQTEEQTYLNLDEIQYVHVFVALAHYYLKNALYNDLDDLLSHIEETVNRNNKPVSFFCYVHYLAGRMYYEQGLYEEALNSLLMAKEKFEKNQIIVPCYFKLLESLSLCYLELDDYDHSVNTINNLFQYIDNKEYDSGEALFYDFAAVKYFVEALGSNSSNDNAIKAWGDIYDLTLDKKGLLEEVHLFVIQILSIVANQVGNEEILKELVDEAMISSMPMHKKNYLSKLLYQSKLKKSDMSIINDVLQENEFIKKKVVSDICHYSELERSKLWIEDANSLNLNNFLLVEYWNNEKVCQMCYDNVLLVKNLKLNSDIITKRAQTDNYADPRIRCIDSIKSKIIYSRLLNIETETLSRELIRLERELVTKNLSPQIISEYIYNWKDVRDALKNDEAAVEIIHYLPLYNSPDDPFFISFAALVLTKDSNAPKCVLLGNLKDYQYEFAKALGPDKTFINELYSSTNNLYFNCWAKIMPLIEGKKKIYLSTSYAFSSIDFSCLKMNDSDRVCDYYEIHHLTSTNVLAERSHQIKTQYANDKSMVLYGNTDFKLSNVSQPQAYSLAIGYENPLENDNTRSHFGFLIGTKQEVDSIFENLKSQSVAKITDDRATETSFRKMSGQSPYILHIATHGFNHTNPFSGKDVMTNSFSSELVSYDKNQSALLSTGLLFTNTKEQNYSFDNDGVLFSEDIANLDLSNTELVVLSACQTGRGDFSNVFGIIGLPRAFKLAGAKMVLCSLWDVDDEATALLMISFYRSYMKHGSAHKALQEAQNIVKEAYPDPYYWAGFILLD